MAFGFKKEEDLLDNAGFVKDIAEIGVGEHAMVIGFQLASLAEKTCPNKYLFCLANSFERWLNLNIPRIRERERIKNKLTLKKNLATGFGAIPSQRLTVQSNLQTSYWGLLLPTKAHRPVRRWALLRNLCSIFFFSRKNY